MRFSILPVYCVTFFLLLFVLLFFYYSDYYYYSFNGVQILIDLRSGLPVGTFRRLAPAPDSDAVSMASALEQANFCLFYNRQEVT